MTAFFCIGLMFALTPFFTGIACWYDCLRKPKLKGIKVKRIKTYEEFKKTWFRYENEFIDDLRAVYAIYKAREQNKELFNNAFFIRFVNTLATWNYDTERNSLTDTFEKEGKTIQFEIRMEDVEKILNEFDSESDEE